MRHSGPEGEPSVLARLPRPWRGESGYGCCMRNESGVLGNSNALLFNKRLKQAPGVYGCPARAGHDGKKGMIYIFQTGFYGSLRDSFGALYLKNYFSN